MNQHMLVLVIVGIVISVGTFVGAATVQEQELVSGTDIEVTVEKGVIETEGSTTTVWASESVSVLTGPSSDRAGEHYIYCLDFEGEEWGCEQGRLSYGDSFSFDIPANELSTGRHQLSARIHEDGLGLNNPLIEKVTFVFNVISKDGDSDSDGLSNQREIELGTDYERSDTDRDGLNDEEEVNRYDTDPTVADTDGDGLDDGTEINDVGTDPTSPHTDSDGVNDGDEVQEYGTDPTKTDTDGDSFDDGTEINRGSDPTNPNDVPENDETDQSERDEESEDVDTNSNTEDPVGSSSEESAEDQRQRGFFTNNPNSGMVALQSAFNITVFGFLLSIGGILLQLRRER